MTIPTIQKYLTTELATIVLPAFSITDMSSTDNATEFTSPSNLSQWLYNDSFFLQEWAVTIPALTDTEKETLQTFWETHKGRVIPFIFIHPITEVIHYVRFSVSTLSFTRVHITTWSCTFTLLQAHPLEIEEVTE